jgi:hypothetical protein
VHQRLVLLGAGFLMPQAYRAITDRKLCEKTHCADAAVLDRENRHRTASPYGRSHYVKRRRSKMKTIIAALLSNPWLAGPATSQTSREGLNLKVVIAFSLVGLLATLYMATHYPLPVGVFAVPLTTD